MAGTCKCGKPATHGDQCQECYEKERSEFQKVKDYIMSHPRANAFEIVKATGVPSNKVIKFMREKRILQKDD